MITPTHHGFPILPDSVPNIIRQTKAKGRRLEEPESLNTEGQAR